MQGFADFFDGLLGGALLFCLALAVGGVVWAIAVLRVGWRSVDPSIVGRAIAITGAGALGLAVCQVAALGLKARLLADYVGPEAYWRFLETLQCRVGLARALCALTLAAVMLWVARAPADRTRWSVAGVVATFVVVSGGWLVHAAGRLEHRAPLMALTVAHQLGAAVWVGGVVQLGALWRLARQDRAADAVWPVMVARFSAVAVGAVVLLLVAAAPLTWVYVASWDGLVGTGYGSLLLTKIVLLGAALLLGTFNFVAGRRRAAPAGASALRTRVPYLIEAEIILLIMVLVVAASLSAQPPPVDTSGEVARWDEVARVFAPKWPSLRTPSIATMREDPSDPYAVVGGERTVDAYSWSNFSHNVAGLVLLAMSAVALVGLLLRSERARRAWPLGFAVLALFVFLRASANDGTWPFGSGSLWRGDSEGLQHRLAALLALALGLFEWRARTTERTSGRQAFVFPVLAAAGGVLLLTHSHTAFELKSSYLIQVTHTAMGALAVLMACARLLELRLPPPGRQVAQAASTVAMLLIALVLVFYREANVVLPPGS